MAILQKLECPVHTNQKKKKKKMFENYYIGNKIVKNLTLIENIKITNIFFFLLKSGIVYLLAVD